MESVTSYVKMLPATGAEIDLAARQIIEAIENGNFDVLDYAIRKKAIQNMFKAVDDSKAYKENLVTECEKYPTKSFEAFGAKVTLSERSTYTYNDAEIDRIDKEIEQLKAQRKARELIIKSHDFDPATGEELIKAKCETNQVVSISFKK